MLEVGEDLYTMGVCWRWVRICIPWGCAGGGWGFVYHGGVLEVGEDLYTMGVCWWWVRICIPWVCAGGG